MLQKTIHIAKINQPFFCNRLLGESLSVDLSSIISTSPIKTSRESILLSKNCSDTLYLLLLSACVLLAVEVSFQELYIQDSKLKV